MLSALAETPTIPASFTARDYPWRVLRCETSREIEANRHLEYRGVTTYLPTFQLIRRWSHRSPETITKALFSGYVFICAPDADMNLAITSPHVYELLRFGREDAVIDAEELLRIQALSQMAAEPWTQIAPGAPIRVIAGPLRGFTGRLISHKSKLEVGLEIEMLNRWIKTSVEGYQIEPA